MKKIYLILTVFLGAYFNFTFSMQQKLSQEAKHSQDQISKIINSIKILKQNPDSSAFNKFEQLVNNQDKSVTDLSLKRILDSLELIDADGKVNDQIRKAYEDFKQNS